MIALVLAVDLDVILGVTYQVTALVLAVDLDVILGVTYQVIAVVLAVTYQRPRPKNVVPVKTSSLQRRFSGKNVLAVKISSR